MFPTQESRMHVTKDLLLGCFPCVGALVTSNICKELTSSLSPPHRSSSNRRTSSVRVSCSESALSFQVYTMSVRPSVHLLHDGIVSALGRKPFHHFSIWFVYARCCGRISLFFFFFFFLFLWFSLSGARAIFPCMSAKRGRARARQRRYAGWETNWTPCLVMSLFFQSSWRRTRLSNKRFSSNSFVLYYTTT